MGAPLRGREDAGRLAVVLAAVPVRGGGDQAPGRGGPLRPWCERRSLRRHGLLGRREDVACGRRTRYVLCTLDAKVHPSCVHGLKHFFGRSGVALRDAELLERFRPPCTRDCKGFTSSFRNSSGAG